MAQAFQPVASWMTLGGTGFPACAPHTSRWQIYEETPDGSALGVWALARFLHPKQLPGEKEKNALAGCQLRPLVPKRPRANASRSLGKPFFSFSPALETPGAQKRAKAHSPGLLHDHARVSFIVSGFLAS